MEIYVEYVLLQNFVIDFFIFKTTSAVLKVKGKFFVLTSLLASIMALLLPLFNLNFIGEFFLKLFFAIILVSLTFSYQKFSSFLKIYFTFLFCTFLYGGVCAFFVQSFGNLHTLIVLLIVSTSYFIVMWILKIVNKRKQLENFCFNVELKNGDIVCRFKGFLDTGNFLYDPISQKPVSLVSFKVFKELFNVEIEDIFLKKIDTQKIRDAHYITLGTAVNSSKVLVFTIDEMKVGDKEKENPMLALCYKNFKDYEILLNNSFA